MKGKGNKVSQDLSSTPNYPFHPYSIQIPRQGILKIYQSLHVLGSSDVTFKGSLRAESI